MVNLDRATMRRFLQQEEKTNEGRALDGEETRKEAGQEISGETGVQKGPEEVGFPVTSKNRGLLCGMGGVTPLGPRP